MEIKFLTKNEGVIHTLEFQNANGGAPLIWSLMGTRYLGFQTPSQWLFDSEKIWPLYKQENVPLAEKAVLLMTYDRAVVTKPYFSKACEDILNFLDTFKDCIDPERVNHWYKIADAFKQNPNCEAIGFYWTSVGEDPFLGEYDEECEEYLKFSNWNDVWSVYHTLEIAPEAK